MEPLRLRARDDRGRSAERILDVEKIPRKGERLNLAHLGVPRVAEARVVRDACNGEPAFCEFDVVEGTFTAEILGGAHPWTPIEASPS